MGAERIHFLWNREDAISFLPKQDLFILPALRDASPRVVREAMACGVPCIVTDIPGARDLIVDNESGILVPSGSAEKIAEAMRSLMDDRTKLQKLAKASRERIINEFSVEAYVSYFDKLLPVCHKCCTINDKNICNRVKSYGCSLVVFFFKFILFDLDWSLNTTFSSFSFPQTYLTKFLLASLLAVPFLYIRSRWYLITVGTLIDLLLIVNLMYFRTYYTSIPWDSYFLA